MNDTLEIRLMESHSRKFTKVIYDQNGSATLHVFWPYGGACEGGIGSDNTCRTLAAPKEFVEDNINNDTRIANVNIKKELCEFIAQKQRLIRNLRNANLGALIPAQEQLIQQAELYLEAITYIFEIPQGHPGSIKCLFGFGSNAFGCYPEAMQALFKKKDRNVFSMLLCPTELDYYPGTVEPSFTVSRPTRSDSPSSIIRDFFKESFKKLSMDTRTPLGLARKKVADECFNPGIPMSRLVNTLAEKLLEHRLCIQDLFALRGKLSSSTDLTEIFDHVDELGYWISGWLNNNKYKPAVERCGFFKELDLYPNNPDGKLVRANTLSVWLQFFLGEVCLRARYLGITSTNFGSVLEQNYQQCRSPKTESMLAMLTTKVSDALVNNQSVEAAIFGFINQHRIQFGLSRELSESEQKTIGELFNTHYEQVRYTSHFDDFTIHYKQDPGKRSVSFNLGTYLAFHLIDILSQAPYDNDARFDRLRRSCIAQEILLLPSDLSSEEKLVCGVRRVEKSIFMDEMSMAIAQKKVNDLRALLFKTSRDENIFEILGQSFFTHYHNNQEAQKLFSTLSRSIGDEVTATNFHHIVCGGPRRIKLTIDKSAARSLHAALEDRRELPVEQNGINRVLEYYTPKALKMVLQDLSQGERDSQGQAYFEQGDTYPEIADCDVTQNDNGTLSINASEGAAQTIRRIIQEYSEVTYIPMVTSAAVYKMIAETLGLNHQAYIDMMHLSNNTEGDYRPRKFMEALRLLQVPYTEVTYNNTRNNKPYSNSRNRDNPSIAKKGGSGFIIRGLGKEHSDFLEQVQTIFTKRLIIEKKIRGALYRKIHELGGFKELIVSNTSPRACLEHALLRLGIEFSEVEWSERAQDFVAILPPKEQAKLRVLTKSFYPSDADFPALNNEDKQYTQGLQFVLRPMNDLPRRVTSAPQSAHAAPIRLAPHLASDLDPTAGWEKLVLNPEQARSVYVALQDRTDLPLEHVLRYHTPEAFTNVLNSLYLVSCRDTQFDRGLDVFANFKVSQVGQNQLEISAPPETIAKLNCLITEYANAIHLSMDMNAGIYKTLSDELGDTSPQIIEMNRLNNNTPNDPTPYKIIRALELLLRRDIPLTSIRYNNTLNELAYRSPSNQNDGLPKKGGSGFIVFNLLPREVAQIEACTEKQAYVMRLDPFYEQAILDAVCTQSETAELLLNTYTERKDKLEAALIMLGFKFKNLQFKNEVFTLETDLVTQSCIKKIMNIVYTPALRAVRGDPTATVDSSIVIFNKEDVERVQQYQPRLIVNSRLLIQQAKNQELPPFPPVLPYRHYPPTTSQGSCQLSSCLGSNSAMATIQSSSTVSAAVSSSTQGPAVNRIQDPAANHIQGPAVNRSASQPPRDFNSFRLRCMMAALGGLIIVAATLVALHLPGTLLAAIIGAIVGAIMLAYSLCLLCLPPQGNRSPGLSTYCPGLFASHQSSFYPATGGGTTTALAL